MTKEEVLKSAGAKGKFNVNKAVALKAMDIYALQSRIQERKNHIYVMEQDLMDNGPEGEGIYSEDYRKCMADEIENHKAYIADMENELNKLNNKSL
jgi:hypothetical protein